MSIFDPPTNRLEEIMLNCISYDLYLNGSKNEGWAPEFALDDVDPEDDGL